MWGPSAYIHTRVPTRPHAIPLKASDARAGNSFLPGKYEISNVSLCLVSRSVASICRRCLHYSCLSSVTHQPEWVKIICIMCHLISALRQPRAMWPSAFYEIHSCRRHRRHHQANGLGGSFRRRKRTQWWQNRATVVSFLVWKRSLEIQWSSLAPLIISKTL